ncbi:RNA polymerase sigma factor [Pseudomonas sp. SWRI59]|uniref:RNA polymerase sigma factor n=1 Tax=Pseudomonas TaxID=286 RepID=UPI00164729A8|nr:MULTISPECIES: RNA polymerase sigma factor [unclassified Pseudomonas]MBC3481517.1 RNA polymerase sigma factor [Pseudomonas sp. SWRI77]MBC3502233.1 RNA polymerase sigma factor [Pseudomonas sp. SWRI59]MBC3506131.1 RNA polymerase sigma factor [Pseudomonas sp. SWRI68]UVL02372.1 RNA polymerase sigma factor [Pseudomonas sp. B21-047]
MSGSDLKALYLAHREEIQEYLDRRLRCKETAADLTQDAFIRLSEQMGRSRIENFRAYLFSSARNLFIDHTRRQQHRKSEPLDSQEVHATAQPSATLEQAAIANQQLAALNTVIQNMPAPCREVFLMVRVEGMTYADIGTRLGISPKTAYSRMVKALELLKQGMSQ